MANERGISKVEFSTDCTWATGAGTFTEIPITNQLREGLEPATPEVFSSETPGGQVRQTGIRWSGRWRAESDETAIPPENTPVWFRVTPFSGAARLYGGVNGAKCRLHYTGTRDLSGGPAYVDIVYTFTAADTASGIKAAV